MTLFDRMKDVLERWTPRRGQMQDAIAATNGTHSEDDVLAMILGGRLQLVTSDKSACAVETVDYPRLKALNIFLGSGDLLDMLAHEPDLIAVAKERSCQRLTMGGRPEWLAALKDRPDGVNGWKLGGVFLYKDL